MRNLVNIYKYYTTCTKMAYSYSEFYQNMTGFRPYIYQERVKELLLEERKNVILSVPTGAGKTWASVIPFLYAQQNDLYFPEKMIYSLPLRALTNSIYEDVQKVLKKNGYSEDDIKRQTGEFADDKFFEKEIIFSTIDQTLSNFLCFPLPLSDRQANINAGALIGSYLVFDEFHLLDTSLSMATTLGMLKMLENLCRCCIMTATLSEDFMKALKENLPNYEIITLEEFPQDKRAIKSLIPEKNKKLINVKEQTLSAGSILENHKNKTIVICNRVETAQKIYQDIIETLEKNDLNNIDKENIICLHSRFFDTDRKEKENKLKLLLGKDVRNQKTNTILIATQVIEAGMDISCDVMHTEISPVNSFLQRAGRCARFEEETGEIFVYEILDSENKINLEIAKDNDDRKEIGKINNKYLPYDELLCTATLNELKKYNTLDGQIPNCLIEAILGEQEKDIIRIMSRGQHGGFNQDKIIESWEACLKNHYRSTIRDIQSVEITLIREEQCTEIERFPYRYQSLGMYKWSFVSWLNKIQKGEHSILFDPEEDWLVKVLDDNSLVGEIENDEEIKYELKKVSDFQQLPPQVYVNAKYFGYSPYFGFNWQYAETFNSTSPRRERKEKEDGFEPLKKDTFYQHNMGLIRCFEREFLPKFQGFTFQELAKYIEATDMRAEDFERLIKLMIILHDYGKLNEGWQKPMQRYQAAKENIAIQEFKDILAHTDYDSKNESDIKLAKKARLHERPGHSGVGAYIAQEIIPDLFDKKYVKGSVSMAIARHHGPLSDSYPTFSISSINYTAIKKLLKEFDLNVELEKTDIEDNLEGFETGWHGERILYLFFVRILRLCDQKATENLQKYFKES